MTITIYAKDIDIGLVSCCERLTGIKAKVLFTMPMRTKPIQNFPDIHVTREQKPKVDGIRDGQLDVIR